MYKYSTTFIHIIGFGMFCGYKLLVSWNTGQSTSFKEQKYPFR